RGPGRALIAVTAVVPLVVVRQLAQVGEPLQLPVAGLDERLGQLDVEPRGERLLLLLVDVLDRLASELQAADAVPLRTGGPGAAIAIRPAEELTADDHAPVGNVQIRLRDSL